MTAPGNGQLAVNQADYIQTLEDEVAREAKARRVLQALLTQRGRTLAAYVERYGDITEETGAEDAAAAGTGSVG